MAMALNFNSMWNHSFFVAKISNFANSILRKIGKEKKFNVKCVF
jgi:hypothetical protein